MSNKTDHTNHELDTKRIEILDVETKLTSDQQQSLITHWNDANALYKHTKEKLNHTTNLCRKNKLKQQMTEHNKYQTLFIDDIKNKAEHESTEIQEQLEWNYLLVCINQLLKLNNKNVSFHLLAIQVYQSIYQSHSIDADKYWQSAIKSCDIGIDLCLLHLNGHHSSFYLWITTFYVLKAQILFQQRKWSQVIECIAPSLNYQESDNIHLLYNLRASAYCEMKQFDKAIFDYGLAIDKSAEPSSYYNSRGTCWHELGKYDAALDDYNEAIECNKKCVSAYNNRASLYVDTKEYQKALDDANKGLNIFKNHGNLYKHRALAHFYLKNYEQCLMDLQLSIKFAPDYRPARIALKMLWEFYYEHLIEIMDIYITHHDVIVVLTDFIVGDNYETNDNMVDATYADWKKEMALIEKENEKNNDEGDNE